MRTPTLLSIMRAMQKKEYKIFYGNYNVNIVGIRTDGIISNTFDDFICVFYESQVTWPFFVFPATTDPGTYYIENPINLKGTALLKEGQHLGCFEIGLHRNSYKALVQKKPLPVYRESKREIGDLNVVPNRNSIDIGMFGINIHRASPRYNIEKVGKFSAGCQVIQDPSHFAFFIEIVEKSSRIYGNSFSYTLLNESDFFV